MIFQNKKRGEDNFLLKEVLVLAIIFIVFFAALFFLNKIFKSEMDKTIPEKRDYKVLIFDRERGDSAYFIIPADLFMYNESNTKKKNLNVALSPTINAVKNKDLSLCDDFKNEATRLECKITASALLKNSSFCNQKLDESLTFRRYSNLYGEEILMNSKDFCWAKMSWEMKKDFCDNINEEKVKEVCKERLKIAFSKKI